MGMIRLLVCIAGVYATFLLWAIAQERLSKPFPRYPPLSHTSSSGSITFPHGDTFPSSTFISALQALASCSSAGAYLFVKKRNEFSNPIKEAIGARPKGWWHAWTRLVGWDMIFRQTSTTHPQVKGVPNGNGPVKGDQVNRKEMAKTYPHVPIGASSSGSRNEKEDEKDWEARKKQALQNVGLRAPSPAPSSTSTSTPTSSASDHKKELGDGLKSRTSIDTPSSLRVWSNRFHSFRKSLLPLLIQVSLFQTSAGPIGFAALRHISYPTMVLGKSCKLVPVLVLNVLLYRRKFKPYKWAVVALVTAGISVFMMYGKQKKGGRGGSGNSAYGLALLVINLFVDGLTNSTQDEIFSLYPKFSGQQLMFNMNFISLCITLPVLVLPPALPYEVLAYLHHTFGMPVSASTLMAAASTENASAFTRTVSFLITHPSALAPLVQFALLGGLGQLFIFETISHFGSLTLVMLTVTRKLVTMLLSVFVFGHQLTSGQWAGVAVVFSGIGLEAAMKRKEILDKRIAAEQHKSKLKAL